MECKCETCVKKDCPDRTKQDSLRKVIACVDYTEQEHKPTKADRIRAMTDEELEKFINHFNICDMRTNDECKFSYCACCEVCVMDWLQEPAEGDA